MENFSTEAKGREKRAEEREKRAEEREKRTEVDIEAILQTIHS
jgi:hypothetical protein